MTQTAEEAHATRNAEVLWERVTNQDRAIRALAEETSSQFRDFRAENSRVIGDLAASIKSVDAKIDAAAAKAADAQRPQYLGLFGAMIGAVGLSITIMQTLSGLHDKPIDDKLVTLQGAISDLTKSTASAFTEAARGVVSRQEFQQATEFRDKLTAALTAGRDQVRAGQQAQIARLAADVVSRRELQFHWDANEKDGAHVQQQIEAMNRRLDELAPAGDLLKRLDGREHELELRVFGHNGAP